MLKVYIGCPENVLLKTYYKALASIQGEMMEACSKSVVIEEVRIGD